MGTCEKRKDRSIPTLPLNAFTDVGTVHSHNVEGLHWHSFHQGDKPLVSETVHPVPVQANDEVGNTRTRNLDLYLKS